MSSQAPAPHLKPCPFCGRRLVVKWRPINPRAHCATEGCLVAARAHVLNLDVPAEVAAWNMRAEEDVVMRELLAALKSARAALELEGYLNGGMTMAQIDIAIARAEGEEI